jgi:hypothetical protein|nr:MAG TPA: hypothetical protein [Crassvirales sp.]
MKKIFLLLIKYLPVTQMAGFLFNNTMYCYYDTYELSYILDFIIGNTIINTILLYIISYIFKFCNWYRLIVTANFINLLVASYDANWRLPVEDMILLCIYYIVATIFILTAAYIHIKYDRNKTKNQTN